MRRIIIAQWLFVLAGVLVVSQGFAQQEKSSVPDATKQNAEAEKEELRAANDQFYAALNALFTGDFTSMNAIWSHRDDVSTMGPFGGRLTGWEAVGGDFKKVGDMKLGGHVVCKDLIVQVGNDMGYTVCVELGENMSADGQPVMVNHRATNVFRRENGQWKLVHHHTDISPQLEKATGVERK